LDTLHSFIFLSSSRPCGRPSVKQKTRDWLAIAGLLKFYLRYRLELSSHVANGPGKAMPNGHLSIDAPGAQAVFNI
jgi:hypothetical protein